MPDYTIALTQFNTIKAQLVGLLDQVSTSREDGTYTNAEKFQTAQLVLLFALTLSSNLQGFSPQGLKDLAHVAKYSVLTLPPAPPTLGEGA